MEGRRREDGEEMGRIGGGRKRRKGRERMREEKEEGAELC